MPEQTCYHKNTSIKQKRLTENITKFQKIVGPVQRKLLELGEVKGIVAGNFREVSEDTHALVAALATCRVQVAGVSRGRRKDT